MTSARRNMFVAVVRRLWPRSWWGRALFIGVPLLLALTLLDPLVGLFGLLASLSEGVLRPILSDPNGRLLAVCVCLFIGAWLTLHLLRNRLRSLRAGLVLRRHLDGLAAYLRDDRRRARELWLGVARGRGPLPSEYKNVRADACLKLARLALEAGAPGEAMAWALRVHGDGLPPTLSRSLAQVRARAVIGTRDSLPESCRREVAAALARWPDDVVLLRLHRDLLLQDGELHAAAQVQERVWRAAEPARNASERDAVVQCYLAAAEAALARNALDDAKECVDGARAVDAAAVASSLIEGELRWRLDDLEGALRLWARVPGSAALARCAEALDAKPDRLSPREILECCPTEGGLLLVARVYARRGETRRALRAARRAARHLGPSPTVSVVLAEVLRMAGDPGAEAFVDEATARLLRSV